MSAGRNDAAPRVLLYGRAGCHLCEDAERLLARLAAELGFAWQTLDIDTDADLLSRYDQAVPVICLDGREIARAPIRPSTLRARLRGAPGSAAR
ncbi:MAG TPA: glutaredoxin family protein [Dehalococcoidia bacterium]|nr:glutaredoxin family protein [Dehalococcoidia bacterium]